jgi:hypothetical protein
MVASAAALLAQAVDHAGALSNLPAQQQKSAKALLVRTLLMAGATKEEFPNWRKGFAVPATDGAVPLDYRYGAGELNIDNSHRILTTGEQNANDSADVLLAGWDFETARPVQPLRYFVEVPPFSYVDQFTTTAGTPLILTPSLANIDLHLFRAINFTPAGLKDQSVSAIDNVEHIYLRSLPAGRYMFEITSDTDWKYAIAWDVKLGTVVGVDFNGDTKIDQADLEYFAGCSAGANRPLPRPDCISTDLDADGDADLDDFGRFQRCLTAAGEPPDPACSN